MTAPAAVGGAVEGARPSFVDLTRQPDIRVRLAAGWRIERSGDGGSFALANERGAMPPFEAWSAAFEPANEALRDGAPLGELRDIVIEAGDAFAAGTYVVLLQSLCRQGFLEFALADDAGEHAVLQPLQEDFVPSLGAEPAATDMLDRFALLRRDSGAWLLESPLSGARIRMRDLGALENPLVRRALAGAGFLRPGQDGRGGLQSEALEQWEFHDLVFHCRSRGGWHRDDFGAAFAHIGEIEPPPAVRPVWPGDRLPLPRAPAPAADEPFASVLERRRSERKYDESQPISKADLGALLDRCAAVRSRSTDTVSNALGKSAPFETSRRPYPSAGASYELEIYPVIDRCADLESGCYHYDAGAHALVRIGGRTPEVEAVLQEAHAATAGIASPQVVLVLSARFSRVMWKYSSIAYSLILRNAGALYQAFYLAATELGLSPCGIGSGNSVTFAAMTGLDPWVEGSVGDFILGGPPRRE